MGIASLYRKLALSSPYMEVALRHLYWNHRSLFTRFNPYKASQGNKTIEEKKVDFNQILDWLREHGIKEGDLVIVHSSYDSLQCTGLSPEEIVTELLKLVGEKGTLAMPVIRRYRGEPKMDDLLKDDTDNNKYIYKVKKTAVVTGMLAYTLMKTSGSVTSRHPLNPMTAYGPLAVPMMEHNLDGDKPSPHGPNSSWKFCYDHNAWVISLGVDIGHFNTMAHVAEEAFGRWRWSDDEWFRIRSFQVIDDDFSQDVLVRERRPKWGTKYSAELNSYDDVLKHGIVERTIFGDGCPVCIESARSLVDHLFSINKNGHPYYILSDIFKFNKKIK